MCQCLAVCMAYVCEYVFRLLVRPVWMTCLSNVWAELWTAPGREREGKKKQGHDFNPADSLSLFGFGRMQPSPSQFSPCVGERRSGLFTFPLCAKLSWFLAMNKMHTRSDAHADIHACTHKHPHCLPCALTLALAQMWNTNRETGNSRPRGYYNAILDLQNIYRKIRVLWKHCGLYLDSDVL